MVGVPANAGAGAGLFTLEDTEDMGPSEPPEMMLGLLSRWNCEFSIRFCGVYFLSGSLNSCGSAVLLAKTFLRRKNR